MSIHRCAFFAFALALCVLHISPAEAAIRLSVLSRDGGGRVDFGRVDRDEIPARETRARVLGSSGEPYHIYLRLLDPPVNEQGLLLDRNAILVSGLQGSHEAGTLYLHQSEPPRMTDQLVYSSTQDGLDDAFTLVWHVDPQALTESGHFRGRVILTARGLSGGGVDESIFEIVLTVPESRVASIRPERGGGVRLGPLPQNEEADVLITTDGSERRLIRIYHEFLNYPRNETNQELSEDSVKMLLSDARTGNPLLPQARSLERMPFLLLSESGVPGEMVLRYRADPDVLSIQPAGLYRGQTQLSVETDHNRITETFPFTVRVDPVFELHATPGAGGLRFNRLMPDSGPIVKEMLLEVESNLGRPYGITQSLSGPLTNTIGTSLEQSFFEVRVEQTEGEAGDTEFDQFRSLQSEDAVIFRSDSSGSPVRLRVFYRIQPYPDMPPGDFQSSMTYSLSEL